MTRDQMGVPHEARLLGTLGQLSVPLRASAWPRDSLPGVCALVTVLGH